MARGRGGRQRGGGSRGRSTQEEEEETTEVEQSLEDDTDEEEEVKHGIPVTYTEDNKIIIDIRGLWFNSKYVVRGVTASTQQKKTRGITCWSDASEEEKEGWFNNFRQNFHWPKEQERAVWERYNYIGKKRLRDNMYKVSKRKKPPQFMEGTAYKELMEKRDTPEFKEKSARAAINKRGGKKDAHIDATHYGGSQSFYDRAMSNAAKNKGKMPTVPELFYETHTKEGAKGKRVWNSKKNANLYAKFRLRKERNPDISDNELWLDLVDGFNKGGCMEPERQENSSTTDLLR